MESRRIDGIKYNFDRLTDQELENIHGYLVEDRERIDGEIEVVESALFERRHPQLDFAEDLGATAVSSEVDYKALLENEAAWERFITYTKDS